MPNQRLLCVLMPENHGSVVAFPYAAIASPTAAGVWFRWRFAQLNAQVQSTKLHVANRVPCHVKRRSDCGFIHNRILSVQKGVLPPQLGNEELSDRRVNYIWVKYLHIGCATLSSGFFLVRGMWMLRSSAMLQRRWVRVVPHVVDSVLLGSALTMVALSGQYPFVQAWLTAKVLALLVYIVLGSIALKRGKSLATRRLALLAALAVFSYIVAVALTRQALPLR